MKIAILNLSGNVGKTVIASNLLQPRMPGAEIFSVETSNQGLEGDDIIKLAGKEFDSLSEAMMLSESAIVDIGSSNIEALLRVMKQYKGSHEDFDYFLIPVLSVPDTKTQVDGIKTAAALSSIGVPASKIKIIFNKAEIDNSNNLPADYPAIFSEIEAQKNSQKKTFNANNESTIYYSDIYDKLRQINKNIADIMTDPTDYRAEMRKPGLTQEQKENFAFSVGLKRLATSTQENLDNVFNALSLNI